MPANVAVGLDDVQLAFADQPRMNFKLRAVVAEPDGCVAVEFVFALQLPRQPPQPFVCGAVGDTDRIDQPPAFVVVAALGGLVDGVFLVVTDVGHGLCTLLCGVNVLTLPVGEGGGGDAGYADIGIRRSIEAG